MPSSRTAHDGKGCGQLVKPTWKDIACERINFSKATQDVRILDELIRLEIDEGFKFFQLRDEILACLMSFVANGIISKREVTKSMRGLELAIQILRTEVADKYRAIAEESDGELLVSEQDGFQPPAVYQDPKTQRT